MVSFMPRVFQNFFNLDLFYIQPPACRQRGFQFTNKATKAQRTTGGPERLRNFFQFHTAHERRRKDQTFVLVSYHRDFFPSYHFAAHSGCSQKVELHPPLVHCFSAKCFKTHCICECSGEPFSSSRPYHPTCLLTECDTHLCSPLEFVHLTAANFRVKQTWVFILSHVGCVTLCRWLNLSDPSFLHLQSNNSDT